MLLTKKYCSTEEISKVQQFVRCTCKKIQLLSFNSLSHIEETFFLFVMSIRCQPDKIENSVLPNKEAKCCLKCSLKCTVLERSTKMLQFFEPVLGL